MEFSNRSNELEIIQQTLSYRATEQSIFFNLIGKSGAGKTELLRQAVKNLVNEKLLFVYIDITPDEFQASSFFATLIETVSFPIKHHYNTITNIPEEFSLSKYIRKIVRRHKGFDSVIKALTLSFSAIPYVGGTLSSATEKIHTDDFYSLENFFFIYLRSIIKKVRVNIIIDNYQFLPDTIKRVFEAGINQFRNGITLIPITRIETYFDNRNNFCGNFYLQSLELDYISKNEFEKLIEIQKIDISYENIEKIWVITKGNLKDIDIILNELRINPGYNIIDSRIAIKNLDSIQRSILYITALFPAGMKEEYIIYCIRDILNENEENGIKKAISNLVDLGYIYINSNTHDTIKPTHESVIKHVKETLDTFDFAHFCDKLSDSLEEVVTEIKGTKDYVYLLHCWVGINNTEKLCKKISLVQELINIKYKENAYYYIDTIASALMDVICYLPENTLYKILVSFQRVSDFQTGIDLLNKLRINDKKLYDKLRMFNAKFLIQTYNFEDALKELEMIEDSSEKLLYQTNALQHQGKDDKVLKLLQERLPLTNHDENYYIILRNTAHFFSFKEAQENLNVSMEYFKSLQYSDFVLATINNNFAIINIWEGNYEAADIYLNKAIQTLEFIRSNEVFEPYCNKSILYHLKRNYSKAIKYAQDSLDNCPKSLTLDIIMLKINLGIIKFCAKQITLNVLYDSLIDIKEQYDFIEDPWNEFLLLYNINQVALPLGKACYKLSDKHLSYKNNYTNEYTKFHVLDIYSSESGSIEFCLGLSPNWRY